MNLHKAVSKPDGSDIQVAAVTTSAEAAAKNDADKPAALERFGAWYLRQRTEVTNPSATPADRDREAARLERWVVVRAALAGALSSLIAGFAEIWAAGRFAGDDWESRAFFWGIVGLVTGLTAVAEIAYLYWDSLRSTHKLAKVVGVEVWLGRGEYRDAFARALARAALELPNDRKPIHGVDPLREASRLTLIVASLAYKLKVAATSFILKLLIRRVATRGGVRLAAMQTALPLVAVPVTAVWNAIVAFKVIREARIRAGGPAAVARAAERLFGVNAAHSERAREAVLRAVASTIVKTQDLHPNVVAFFDEVRRRCAGVKAANMDAPDDFIALLPKLDAKERQTALEALVVASTIDGRLTRKERALLSRAYDVSGLAPDTAGWFARCKDPLHA